jgi:CRISPR-associated protein Csa4
MRYRYYTPCHGVVTDALILHGFLKLLHIEGQLEGVVENIGDRYVVDASRPPDFSFIPKWELYEWVRMAADRGVYVGKIRELFESAIDIGGFRSWVVRFLDALGSLPTDFDLSEQHRENKREGRSRTRKGSMYTLYLPISSIYGKFASREYQLREEPYFVCASCFALATLGYIYSTLKVRVESRNGFTIFNFTFVPQGRMKIRDMLTLQRLGGMVRLKRGAAAALNTPGALVYALSVGETLYAVRERPLVITWITERIGNNQRAHRPSILDVNPLLSFIAELKLRVVRWPRIARFLAENEPAALNTLGEYVLFGGDVYTVVRQLYAAIESAAKKHGKSEAFAGAMKEISSALLETVP